MSAIAGFTGKHDNGIQTMLNKLKHWQPDREGEYIDEDISLGCLELFTTPEAILAPQPLSYKKWIITANCRIDNREELAAEFGIDDVNSIADINYIAFAYEKWGQDCIHHLVGDFAFVIWDKISKKMFGARDHIGIKTLYYSIVNNEFVFSSEIKGIAAYPLFEPQLNEKYFIHNFSLVALPVTETPYMNISQFPAGTYFEWKNKQLEIFSYWEFGKRFVDVPKTLQLQYEQFDKLLIETVKCRLRTNTKIGAEVSGGLDSTGIAAIAMEILGKGSELYSYCYGKAVHSAFKYDKKDDSLLVREFCIQYGIEKYLNVINENDYSIDVALDLLKNVYDDYETNGVPTFSGSYLPDAKNKQVGVMLSGWGGDQVVTNGASPPFLQYSRERQYRRLWDGLRIRHNLRKTFPRFIYHVIKGVNSKGFLKKNIKRNKDKMKGSGLRPEYFKKYGIDKLPGDRYILKSQNELLNIYIQNMCYPGMQKRCYHHDLTGKHFKIEFRFPLLDVRLLEYIISLPVETVAPKLKPRYIFTRAVQDRIPRKIIEIKKSGVPTTPFARAFYKHSNKAVEIEIRHTLARADFNHYFLGEIGNRVFVNSDRIKFLSLALLYKKIYNFEKK